MLRRKRFWLGLLITVACLGFFLARTNLNDIVDSFDRADYLLAIAAVPLYFVGFWIRTIRWRYLLKPIADISVPRLYPVVIIGLMANNIAPLRVGELVRAYLLGQREQINKSTAFGTIAVDRAFDGLTLVAILAVVAVVSGSHAGVRVIGVLTALAFAGGTAVLGGLALSATARGWLARILERLPGGFSTKIEGVLEAFLTGLVAIKSPAVLAKAGLASIASWLVEAVMYWIVGRAFHLNVGFDAYLLIVAAANLALSILASPGGVGPFEFTSKQILISFGVGAPGLAEAYSLALHALLLGPVIIVGLIMLSFSGMSLNDILGVSNSTPKVGKPLTEAE